MQIFVNGLTKTTQESINAMLNSVDIKPSLYSIVDIATNPKPSIESNHLLAYGKKSMMAVVNVLASEGLIQKEQYVGKPLVDEKNGFFFYGIPLEIPEIMKDEANKLYVYEMLCDMANYYLDWCPINDELNFGESPATDPVIAKAEQAITTTEYGIESDGSKISTLELMAKLIEKIDFSDAGLGKSLSKFDKIQLVTNNGYKLNIAPTARDSKETEEKTIDITYKDLFALMKVIIMTGSRSIEFFEDNT